MNLPGPGIKSGPAAGPPGLNGCCRRRDSKTASVWTPACGHPPPDGSWKQPISKEG